MSSGLEGVRAGGKAALARALATLEQTPDGADSLALLAEAQADPRGVVVGLTGPPGVGKSTLSGALVRAWREAGRSVGVIAVDPSSRRTGGALLGDRVRLATDPEDPGVFVRSMAARDRLGGLADLTVAGMVLMRAVFDMVLIETVGVGQSETDVANVADTVVLGVQPGAGDTLQFMKAGIAEVPDVVAVTKGDMGAAAEQARGDAAHALSVAAAEHGPADWTPPVLLVAARTGTGVTALTDTLDAHAHHLRHNGTLAAHRHTQAEHWLREAVRDRFGRYGLARAGDLCLDPGECPFRRLQAVVARLADTATAF